MRTEEINKLRLLFQAPRKLYKIARGGRSAPDGIKSVENRSLYVKPNNNDSIDVFFF